MSALFKTHFEVALNSLRRNHTRSFLTCLGIAIGVASIILILSLTGSIARLIDTQIASAGADLIVVRPTTYRDTVSGLVDELTATNQFIKSGLSATELTAIEKVDGVETAAPLAIAIGTLKADMEVPSGLVVGTTESLTDILPLSLRSGSFSIDHDTANELSAHRAVIGRNLSLNLFGSTEPVGKTFTLFGQKFMVVGALDEVSNPINFNNVNLDNAVLIDYQVLDGAQIQQINIKVSSTADTAAVAQQLGDAIYDAKGGDRNFSVLYGDDISHPSGSLFTIISSMLMLVAGVSLVVGGIGVMNIMLVAVSERTHEIGIRKAVGASNSHIFWQFLFESLTLSLLGGLFGLLLGYLLAFLVGLITPFAPFISTEILLAVLYISVLVGTIFGLYPALKASRKDPITSLKFFR